MAREGQGCGGEGCELAPRGWEGHLGAGMRRLDVEGDYGQLRVSPRQPQPAYQTWRCMTTDGQENAGGTGDSSTRGVAGARSDVGCRKGDEARAWERKGQGEAQAQGRIARQEKIHTEPHEPKYGPWVGCNPQSGNQHRTRRRDVNGRGGRTRW